MQRSDSVEKTLMLGKMKAGGEGADRGWDGWMASLTQLTWVWVCFRGWCWTGSPGVMQLMLSQRFRHSWVTELNWTDEPNIGAPQYVRQMLTSMKGEINSNTIIVGDFNTQLTPIDTSTKQKISEATQTLKDGMDQLDLIDIYRIFHPKPMNFTFFSSAHGTFARTDLISSHKSRLYI